MELDLFYYRPLHRNIFFYMKKQGFEEWMQILLGRFDNIDKTLDRMNKLKECFDGDSLLDYTYDDGRIYYKASEVEKFMKMKC